MKSKIRVLLVDDHPLVREGIRSMLKSRPHIEIVGEAADGDEAIRKTKKLSPEIILMDITMPRTNGIEAAKILRKTAPKSKILALTIHENREYVREMVRSGVRGYVLKDAHPEELLRAIESVHRDIAFFTPRISQSLLNEFVEGGGKNNSARSALTPREREVLALIADGLSNKEAAERLGISARTIETHREHMMNKLDVHNLAGLTKYALSQGLIRAGRQP